MPQDYTKDYLLDKKIAVFQPKDGYRASSDAVLVSSLPECKKEGEKILDVGSGTGAISLCIAHRTKNKNPQIIGVELQKELADLANLSATENDFSSILSYKNIDIREACELKNCSFDHVVSNPPYAMNDLPSPNISKALAHNHHDFSLKKWINFCLKMLKPYGHLYMINRAEALSEIICALSEKAGNIKVIPIYSKKGQEAKRVMIAAQKDSKTPLKIYPPFVVHNSNGEYTDEAQKILREGFSFATATQKQL